MSVLESPYSENGSCVGSELDDAATSCQERLGASGSACRAGNR